MLMSLLPMEAKASQPLEMEELDDETYAEQIVVMTDLDDGSYVKIRFAVSNVGPGDGKGACEFLVIPKSGPKWRDEVIVEQDKRTYDASTQKLVIGPCTATAKDRLVMRAPLPSGTVEIVLNTKPDRRKAHRVDAGDDFYELFTLVRWAPAKVTLQKKGGKTQILTGHGYADHPRSKILPQDLATRWLRFRGLNDKDPRLVMLRFPKRGAPVGWHQSRSEQSKLTRAMLVPKGTGDKKHDAWRARFKGPGGEWRITTRKMLHRNAPVEAQGLLGSVVRAAIGNPVTYTFRGVLEERKTGKRIPGIVEITLTNEKQR